MDRVRAAVVSIYFYAGGLDKAEPPLRWQPIKLAEAGKILSEDKSSNSNARRRRFVIRIAAAAVHESDPTRREMLVAALRAVEAPPPIIELARQPPQPLATVAVRETALKIAQMLDHSSPRGAVNLFARSCCSCMVACNVSKPVKPTDLARVDLVLEVERTSEEVAAATDPLAWDECNTDYFKEAYYAGPNLQAVSDPPTSVMEPVPSHGDAWDGVLFEHVITAVKEGNFLVKNLLDIDTSAFTPPEPIRYRLDYGLAKALALNVLGHESTRGGLVEDCGYVVVTDTGSTPTKMKLRGTKQIRLPELDVDVGAESWLPLALRVVADNIGSGVCCGASSFTGSCDCPELCDDAISQDVLNNDTRLCK
jgi:hypothetical protein